ncbi:hypothetical protein C8F04DRAFT_1177344 [Mycena alexandri]|uniref:Uncharacterized protein n=1 Tax=Mycena alexandri TaxID=1745969 RepID=A0AAD6XAB2_9AGAR|nr:hypothetical protein C8F04DRAFT_1177344 [Mycena alexandri]
MNFIKFGNHVIAPANPEYDATPLILSPTSSPTTPTPMSMAMLTSDPTEVLEFARLLHSKVRELERGVAERKARRTDWRTAVDRLDKSLVALRAQEAKEGEKLAKLVKRWNKATVTGNRNTLGPAFNLPRDFAPDSRYALPTMDDARRYGFDLPRDFAPPQESWFVCPTTQAASAFNGNDERYRDTYTFVGSAWQAPSGIASPCSSPARSPSVHHDYIDERNSFHFTMSPEALDVTNLGAADSPTERGEGHRAAFADIRNTPQEVGIEEGKGRKRKSVDFEAQLAYDGASKKMRAGKLKHYGSGRDERNGKRWSLRRNSEKRSFGQVA